MGQQVVVPQRTVKEQITEQKRNIKRSIRSLEKEKRKLERDHKNMLTEIKKMAKKNQTSGVKMMARDIIRIKGQLEKMMQFVGQLNAVHFRISSISSLNELSNAMEEAANAMTLVSSKLDSQKLATMMKNMSKEDAKLDLKQEMMEEILDGIGESMDNPVEQEELYEQVLKDAGIPEDDIPSIIKGNGNEEVVKKKEEEKKKKVDAEEESLDAILGQLQK